MVTRRAKSRRIVEIEAAEMPDRRWSRESKTIWQPLHTSKTSKIAVHGGTLASYPPDRARSFGIEDPF